MRGGLIGSCFAFLRSHIESRLMVAFFVRKLRPRELRQGDPLSQYLSLLCAVAFSSLLNKADVEGRLKGIKLCNSAPSFNHLMFADDSSVLMKATSDCAMTLQHELEVYENFSG